MTPSQPELRSTRRARAATDAPVADARLRLLRLAWLVGVGLPLALTLASWPAYVSLLLAPCQGCLVTLDMAHTLQMSGVSLELWAVWNMATPVVSLLAWTGVGLLVFARRGDPMTMLMSALLALAGPGFGGFQFDLATYRPEWWLVSRLIQVVSTTSLFSLVLVLPTGRIAPRWTVWPILYLISLNVTNQFFPGSALAFGNWPMGPTLAFFFMPLLASMIGIPMYRYRRVLTLVERQQIKWVVVGVVAFAACVALLLPYSASCQHPLSSAQELSCSAVQTVGYSLTALSIPISVGVAVLRSRLWDVDVIIRRTLIYSMLTGLLALVYFASVIVLENLLRPFTGQGQSPFVTVVSTLAIAALVVPLCSRVQAFIDRRFYRQKYDAARTLAAFGATLRDEVELDRLSEHLVGVVEDAMQPEQVSLWLRPNPRNVAARPAAYDGDRP